MAAGGSARSGRGAVSPAVSPAVSSAGEAVGRRDDGRRGLWAWLWDAPADTETTVEAERREQLIRWHEQDRAAHEQGHYLTCGPGLP